MGRKGGMKRERSFMRFRFSINVDPNSENLPVGYVRIQRVSTLCLRPASVVLSSWATCTVPKTRSNRRIACPAIP